METKVELYLEPSSGEERAHQNTFKRSLDTIKEQMREAREIAIQVGFTNYANQLNGNAAALAALEFCALNGLRPMTQEQEQVWRLWFGEETASRNFEHFTHREGLPVEVMRLINQVRPVFHDLEIWTVRRHRHRALDYDPMLVGVIHHSRDNSLYVPLARWGESDDELVSYEEIRAAMCGGLLTRYLRYIEGNTPLAWCQWLSGVVAIVAGISALDAALSPPEPPVVAVLGLIVSLIGHTVLSVALHSGLTGYAVDRNRKKLLRSKGYPVDSDPNL